MKILVIIVSYNFKRWIDRCLGSLKESHCPVDVLVVDNGSKDGTTDYIKTYYPKIRLIETGENLGFGRANNIGMKIAFEEGYDFAFLLNQDAWIGNETIGTLVEAYSKTEKKYGIISPVHLNGEGNKLDDGFAIYTGMTDKKQCMENNEQTIIPVKFVNAAFWMLPRKTLEDIGGFSPLFRHYGEDIDYINRLKYRNLKIGYVPTVWGCHDREYRTITKSAFLHSEFVYHLSEYANINYTFPKAFAYGPFACIKKMVGKNFFEYLKIFIRVIAKTRLVKKTRKINRNKCNNHINY